MAFTGLYGNPGSSGPMAPAPGHPGYQAALDSIRMQGDRRAREAAMKRRRRQQGPPDVLDEHIRRARATAMQPVGANRASTFATPGAPLASTLSLLGGL